MKIFYSIALVAAALSGAIVSAEEAPKQLFHVTVPKAVFDKAVATFGDDLDVWKAEPLAGDRVQADVYALDSTMAKFQALQPASSGISPLMTSIEIQRDPVNTADFLAERAEVRAACSTRTAGWLEALPLATSYVQNAYFDCWRKPDEVFAFFDTLVSENPTLISKISQVATTIEGRSIPAFKISTGGSNKKSLYTQGGIHAREWHAASTTQYAVAALLDGLKSGDATIKAIFDEYDWYFVPLLNIDGNLFTWTTTRLWRKNRRQTGTSTYGVDLNRNYGPAAYFGKAGDGKSSETYPGTAVLSEPETAGTWAFLSKLPNLKGAVDIHSYSGLVLRPFGYQRAEAPAPWGPKLKTLGDNVAKATMAGNTAKYTSQTSAELYLCYGTFTDAIYSELNKTASVTFEMEGTSFVQPESAIRPGGLHVFQGLIQFAKELKAYYA